MKITTAKLFLALAGGVALLAGCETSNSAMGGMGNDTQSGAGGTGAVSTYRAPASPGSGTISPGNPFGLGSSSGLTTGR